MQEELKNYLNLLFEPAPKTKKALELREELLTNSIEKYEDLIREGMVPEDAYKNVVSSIGDVSELFIELEEKTVEQFTINEDQKKKVAVYKAISTGLYLIGFLVFMVIMVLSNSGILGYGDSIGMIGFLVMILIDIIPTCLLVYVTNAYPNYKKQEETVVEEFKEWKSRSNRNRSLKTAVSAVMWAAMLVFYFVISFVTFAWEVTWILFFVAVCAQTVIILIFHIREMKQP